MNKGQVAKLQALMESFKEHDECLKAHRHSTEKGPPIEKLKTLVNLLDKWVRLYEKLQEVVKDFSPIYGEVSRLRREQLTPAQLNVAYVQDKWDTPCRSLREFIMFAKVIRDDKVQPLQGIDTAGQLDDRTQWIAHLISKLEEGARKIEDHSAKGNKGDLHESISALYYQGVRPAHLEMTFLNVPPLYIGSCGDLPQYVGVGKFRCEFCWINDGLPDYDLEDDDFRIYAEMKNITANLRALLL